MCLYKSIDTDWKGTYNDKEVAIKKEPLSTKHILVEADILKNLKHENIVQMYDLFGAGTEWKPAKLRENNHTAPAYIDMQASST